MVRAFTTTMAKSHQLFNYLLIGCIKGYRLMISPIIGNHCRFWPSCSEYAESAFSRLGIAKGSWYAIKRIIKCHPWHEGGYDPVPVNQSESDHHGSH
jgi:putative membrane protein insertion efficiency factor